MIKTLIVFITLFFACSANAGMVIQKVSGGGGGGGSIGLTGSASSACDTTSPIVVSHTVASGTDALVVGLGGFTTNSSTATCTWNTSESITIIVDHKGADGARQDVYLGYLASPTATTANVSCTMSQGDPGEGIFIIAANLENVDLTGTPGTDAIYEDTCDADAATCTMSTLTSTSLVIAVGVDYNDDAVTFTADGFTHIVQSGICNSDYVTMAYKVNDNTPEMENDVNYETIAAAAFLEE